MHVQYGLRRRRRPLLTFYDGPATRSPQSTSRITKRVANVPRKKRNKKIFRTKNNRKNIGFCFVSVSNNNFLLVILSIYHACFSIVLHVSDLEELNSQSTLSFCLSKSDCILLYQINFFLNNKLLKYIVLFRFLYNLKVLSCINFILCSFSFLMKISH